MSHTFGRDVLIDNADHQVYVDGVQIPWWLAEGGPEVEKIEDVPIHILHLPILIEGTIVIDNGVDREVYDARFGNVREYAIAKVRREFQEAYPWLDLP